MRLDNLTRVAAVAFLLIPLAVVWAGPDKEGGKRESGDDEAAEEQLETRVDWKQIWFSEDRPQSVKITLFDDQAVDKQIPLKERQGLGIAGKEGLVFETQDPVIVDTFTSGLTMPLRVAIPDDPGYGSGGGVRYPDLGYIEVFTNKKRRIHIGINCSGLALGSEDLRKQNIFFSWIIAQQLDDILFLKTERHIPLQTFRAMSGENYIEGQKRNYEFIRNDARSRAEQK